MNQALLYLNYPEPLQAKIRNACWEAGFELSEIHPDGLEQEDACIQALQKAEVAFLGVSVPISALETAPHLKWVHFDWVGIEQVVSQTLFARGVLVTNGRGRNSMCLAEHVIYFMMTLAYDTRAFFEAQSNHCWNVVHSRPYSSLYNNNLLLIGTGSISQEVAKRAKGFSMHVTGFARKHHPTLENFDETYAAEDKVHVEDLLPKADFVALTLPATPQNHHLVSSRFLATMKPSAYLINISRGELVDEEALAEALRNHKIAGAASDVFEKEPLPKESPLWNFPNMLITPHSTPQNPDKYLYLTQLIIENLGHYLHGEHLRNQQMASDVLG